nr:uncharacterized protein LOC108076984 isoform X2 [Drosophila kikkawai]
MLGPSLSQLFLINAIRLEGCNGARHKMQITRRNNQIENETEQGEPGEGEASKLTTNGSCAAAAQSQHQGTISQWHFAQGQRTNTRISVPLSAEWEFAAELLHVRLACGETLACGKEMIRYVYGKNALA